MIEVLAAGLGGFALGIVSMLGIAAVGATQRGSRPKYAEGYRMERDHEAQPGEVWWMPPPYGHFVVRVRYKSDEAVPVAYPGGKGQIPNRLFRSQAVFIAPFWRNDNDKSKWLPTPDVSPPKASTAFEDLPDNEVIAILDGTKRIAFSPPGALPAKD